MLADQLLGKGGIGQRSRIIVDRLSAIYLQIIAAGHLPVVGQVAGLLPLQAIVF